MYVPIPKAEDKSKFQIGDRVLRYGFDSLPARVVEINRQPYRTDVGWCYRLDHGAGWYPESCLILDMPDPNG